MVPDEERIFRLNTIEVLSQMYSGRLKSEKSSYGYYQAFLQKLYAILFGAAVDFGLKPEGFVIVSMIAPLGEIVGGVGILSENKNFYNVELLKHIMSEAAESLGKEGSITL